MKIREKAIDDASLADCVWVFTCRMIIVAPPECSCESVRSNLLYLLR